MASTYTQILLHIVFSTKKRKPLITVAMRERLHPYLGGIIRGRRGVTYQIGGTADHVHILIRWGTEDSLGSLMREVKSESSKWVKQNFPEASHFGWQTGYSAFSVSFSQKKKVVDYILNQETHHRRMDFQEELRKLLKAHEVEFEEKYLWD